MEPEETCVLLAPALGRHICKSSQFYSVATDVETCILSNAYPARAPRGGRDPPGSEAVRSTKVRGSRLDPRPSSLKGRV
eukprot:3601141-Rhodomonas_salina.1